MDVNGACLARIVVTPDAIKELLAAIDAPCILNQKSKKLEGFRLHVDHTPTSQDTLPLKINLRLTNLQ